MSLRDEIDNLRALADWSGLKVPEEAPSWHVMATDPPGHLVEVIATGVGCGLFLVWWDERDGLMHSHGGEDGCTFGREDFLLWTPLQPILPPMPHEPAP